MDENIRAKIASMSGIEHRSAKPEAPKDDSVLSALQREVYVVGGGIADGFTSNLNAPALVSRTPEFVLSMGLGAGLAAAQGKSGMVKLSAQVLGLAFGAAFVKDMTNPERMSGLSTAIGDAWSSADNLDLNRAMVKHHAGDFVFDTTVMGAGGVIGASGFKASRSEAFQNLRGLLANTGEATGAKAPGRTALSATEMRMVSRGLTEPRQSAMGMLSKEGGDGSLPSLNVFPEGPLQMGSAARRLATNAGERPLSEIQATETFKWEMMPGKTSEWKINQDGVAVRLEIQRFVDSFMKGDYEGALRVAVEAPVMERVNLNPKTRPHSETVTVADLAQPDILQFKMNQLANHAQFKWQETRRDGVLDDAKLDVIIPKAIIELKSGTNVALVDFVPKNTSSYRNGYSVVFPETSTTGAKLTPAEVAEISAIRQSPEGKRLLAETAIFGYEETLVHANQHITQGGRITSPTYAEFAKDFGSRSETLRTHRLHFLGMIDKGHKHREMLFEQEVPMLAYDAGMPLSVVKHHFYFGPRHMQERATVMQFLENRELIAGSKAQ